MGLDSVHFVEHVYSCWVGQARFRGCVVDQLRSLYLYIPIGWTEQAQTNKSNVRLENKNGGTVKSHTCLKLSYISFIHFYFHLIV